MKQVKVRLGNRFGFIESGIETIYDAKKAEQHKQQIDDTVVAYETKIQEQDKLHRIIGICLAVVFAVLLIATKGAFWVVAVGFTVGILTALYVGFSQWLDSTSKPSDKYPPDVEYYLATEGKRMLSVTVEPANKYFPSVCIVAENADRSTTKTEIDFKVVEKTDLHHIILNVNEGVVYVPYEREKGRRC